MSDQEQSERRDDRVQADAAIRSDSTEESAAPGTSGGTKAIRWNRDAVVTIQGGGIFGLSLLGQLAAVVYGSENERVEPIDIHAIAGNSAGAIIATLYWAGRTPKEILDLFIELASRTERPSSAFSRSIGRFQNGDQGGGLARILTGDDCSAEKDYARLIDLLDAVDRFSRPRSKSLKNRIFYLLGIPAISPIVCLLIWIYRSRIARYGELLAPVLLVGVISIFAVTVYNLIIVILRVRSLWRFLKTKGVFDGEHFRFLINEWLKDSKFCRDFVERARRSKTDEEFVERISKLDYFLTFGDFHRMSELVEDNDKLIPLFLTATNLTSQKVEAFNSIEAKYRDVEVASAVFASACFPGIFRPAAVTVESKKRLLVDGGVVSNFPAWIFSGLRTLLQGSSRYSLTASRPFVNIGLRMTDRDSTESSNFTAADYYLRLFKFFTGLTRDELEDKLTKKSGRTFLIKQYYDDSEGPESAKMWNVHEVGPDIVTAMFNRGYTIGVGRLQSLKYELPDETERVKIEEILKNLCETARTLLKTESSDESVRYRANVFILGEETEGDQKTKYDKYLYIYYSCNMEGCLDINIMFPFKSGIVGRCLTARRPFVGNLKKVREILRSDDPADQDSRNTLCEYFRIDRDEYLKRIADDLTWVVAVPIFDPLEEISLIPAEIRYDDEVDYCAAGVKNREGPVLAVLCLDSNLDYRKLNLDKNCAVQLNDKRVRALLDNMQSVSRRIAAILFGGFAVEASIKR